MGSKKLMKSSKKKAAPTKKKSAVKKSAAKKPVSKKSAVKKTAGKKTTTTKKVMPAKKAAAKTTKAIVPSKPVKPVKLTDYSKAFTPLADRLVVRVVETEKITAGGIIIPDSASAVVGHLKGEVLAVGGGAKNKKGQVRPLDVRLGDYVLFAQYSGTKIEFNAEELQIVKESDVMGIVQK